MERREGPLLEDYFMVEEEGERELTHRCSTALGEAGGVVKVGLATGEGAGTVLEG